MPAESNDRIALVPARAGSVRLPGKNRKTVGGVTLVERAIRHAAAAQSAMTIVSTDDAQVIELVRRLDNVTLVLRPAELADSDTSTDAVVHHALDSAAIDTDPIVLLLQPTSPFRNRSLIEDCIRAVANSPDSAALSVTRAAKDPAWIRCLGEHGRLLPGPIDCLPVVPTGAVYAFRCERFRRCGTLAGMNRIGVLSDVVHACDIDHEYELVMAQALAEAGFGDDIIDLAD